MRIDTNSIKVLAIVLMLFVVCSCTTNKATGKQDFTLFMSETKEVKVGAQEHPKILEQFGGEYRHNSLNAYITSVGKKLSRLSEVPNLPYRFIILNDDSVNAFALPGGYVYVTRGLLALANNEAEVAGVLAHEIGHITARHTAQRYSTAMATNIGLNIFGIIGSASGLPTGVDHAVSLGANAAIMGYSRSQELEADMLGIRYMTRANYPADSMVSLFKSLNAHAQLKKRRAGKTSTYHDIMATHPRTEVRILKAIKKAKAAIVQNPYLGREQYLKQIDGLIFGDDINHGIRIGRNFVHPTLKFKFQIPKNFTMLNTKRKVTAIGPNNTRIEFSVVSFQNEKQIKNLSIYLKNSWGKDVPLNNVETINVNGMLGKTASGRPRGSRFTLRMVVVRGGPKKIFRFAFVIPDDSPAKISKELRRTTYSLSQLTHSEAKNVQPLRIRIKKIEKNDTIKTLSRKMLIHDNHDKVDWFCILNNTTLNSSLLPGSYYKFINH